MFIYFLENFKDNKLSFLMMLQNSQKAVEIIDQQQMMRQNNLILTKHINNKLISSC